MANYVVSSGIVSSGLTLGSDDILTVLSGGTASAITVGLGAIEIVSAGGSVSGGTDLGVVDVVSGAGAANVTVGSGGVATVGAGGSATGVVVGSGGQFTDDGGTITSTAVSGGTLRLVGPLGASTANGFGANTSGGTIILGNAVNFGAFSNVSSGNVIQVQSGATYSGGTIGTGGRVSAADGSTLSGTVTVTSGGTLFTAVLATGGTAVVSSGGDLALTGITGGSVSYLYTIGSFATGATLDLVGVPPSAITSVSKRPGLLNISSTVGVFGLRTVGTLGGISGGYTLISDGQGGTFFAVCFAEGTMIATPDGERAVEDVRTGDLVSTPEGARPVTWTGHHSLDVSTAPNPDEQRLVRIRKDAFGPDLPHRDLRVTPEHCVFWDGKLIPARMLVNGRSILIDRTTDRFRYFHLELERHGILFAEGLTVESYLDTGNRGNFVDSDVVALRPDLTVEADHAAWTTKAAAPLTVDRADVEPVWAMLAERAGGACDDVVPTAERLTSDPALQVETEAGLRISPLRRDGGRYSFLIPVGAGALRLVSRAERPSRAVGPFVDDRRELGVLVGGITVWQGRQPTGLVAHLETPDLSGWLDVEQAPYRWTTGDAELPLDPTLTAHRPVILAIEIVTAGPYLLHGSRSVASEGFRLSA